MTNQPITAAVRAALVETVANVKEYIARGDITNKAYAAALPEYEARLAKFEAMSPDVDALVAMDKVTIRSVPDALFDLVYKCLRYTPSVGTKGSAFFGEATRRKAARTRAANMVDAAAAKQNMQDFLPGQTVGVHAMGHWYTGKVIRTTRTGSVVVEYTSGTGTTRQKTVGYDKIRA